MQSTSSASTTTSTAQRRPPKNASSSDSDSYSPLQPPVSRHTHSRMPSSSTHTSTAAGPRLLSAASHKHDDGYRRAAPRHSHRSSPLSFAPSPSPPHHAVAEEEWDNTPTSRWGYVLLVTTWLVFVIGMGSCLDVWSWAWDVGETPYAPPELEDDPTLPIVGYYPALMVLTAVMAWVWVGFAWVGMKYFKHAKITGE